MSRYRLLGRVLIVPALLMFLTIAGCGGGDKGGSTSKPSGSTGSSGSSGKSADSGKKASTGDKTAVEAKGKATLKGKVTYGGATPPPRKDLKTQIQAQGDKEHCLKGDIESQEWIVGADKGVENVVVFLRAPEGKYFDVPADQRLRKDTVTMDQPFCQFQPHVIAVNPTTWDPQQKKQVKTGQTFKILNSAPINHNTSYSGNKLLNPGKNTILPAKKGNEVKDLPVEAKACRDTETGKEDLLTVACDIHKWMTGKVLVLDHPYYAVTDKNGNFEIKDAPADAEVVVALWHESMETPSKAQTEKMTLKPGENKKDFTVGK